MEEACAEITQMVTKLVFRLKSIGYFLDNVNERKFELARRVQGCSDSDLGNMAHMLQTGWVSEDMVWEYYDTGTVEMELEEWLGDFWWECATSFMHALIGADDVTVEKILARMKLHETTIQRAT
jgi:hypothetical protein